MVGFIFGGNTGETQESLKRKREMLEQMIMGQRTPQNWGQGVGAILTGIGAGIERNRLNKAETEGRQTGDAAFGKIKSWLMGDSNPSTSSGYASGNIPMTEGGNQVAATTPGGNMGYRDAIASIESKGSGDYGAVGPTHDKLGRALGRYQIMESNIGPWAKAALGKSITPDEFMANPDLQDKIFDHRFGSYVEKYGPEGAAQAWLGGEGGVGKTGRKDSLGTSIGSYGQRFMSALGPGSGEKEVASISPDAAFEAIAATNPDIPFNADPIMRRNMAQQSLTDEVQDFEQTPEYRQQFPGMQQQEQQFDAGRFGGEDMAQMPVMGRRGSGNALQASNQNGMGQQAISDQMSGLPRQFQGSQQIMNAQGGMMPALMEGDPASAQQVAQAQQAGQQQQTQGMSGPSLQELMEIASHPWLSQEQRSMANMLIEQKMREQQSAREEQQWRGRQDYEQQLQRQDPASQLEQDYKRAQIEKLQRDAAVGGETDEFGLNPQYGRDKDGNPVLLQLGKRGKAVQTAMPEGVTLSKEPIKLDAGTHFVLLDPITRQPVGQIPKDLEGAERDKQAGKNLADFRAALPGVEASGGELLSSIQSLEEDPYLGRMVGPMDSWLPNISGDANRVQSKMDQIGGQSFMQAFNMLRGSGQITEQEGRKATEAMARLNTAQSESDYREALNELRGVVERSMGNARLKAGGDMGQPTTMQGGTDYRSRYGLE